VNCFQIEFQTYEKKIKKEYTMKKILGLDLGTNSIGWALIETDINNKPNSIIGLGSRIIPMDQASISDFERGNSKSQTAERTRYRGIRRLRERQLMRRARLHRILNELQFLPEHYQECIDFEMRLGEFKSDKEPKIAWRRSSQNKMEFIFKDSFQEMLSDFSIRQPELITGGKKIPYDWTIYYLRKKALVERIGKEELAWILLNFNQKRGYYQFRGEDDTDSVRTPKTRKYFDRKVITSIVDTGQEYKGLKILIVELEDGNKGKIFKKEIPGWIGQEKNIIATVDLDKDGNDRKEDGILSQRFSIPTDTEWETEWKLIKLKTEKDLEDSLKTVGSYIYDSLVKNPNQKIRGKLVRTIERKFYREELKAILNKQREFHQELIDRKIFGQCIFDLYPKNEAYRNSIANKDLAWLILDDIIFFQRPLKSKKSLISDCSLEERKYMDKETGELKVVPLKCIAKSHPLFQEFRLWQFLSNLRIYKKGKTDFDVTSELLKTDDDYEALFNWLNNLKEIDQKSLLRYPAFGLRKEAENYRWNYVEDRIYPCNETRSMIMGRLAKTDGISAEGFNSEKLEELWHILYSVEDRFEIEKAIKKFSQKHTLGENFVETFRKFPSLKKEYGSYSAKAIRKLLPLMRMGKAWSIDNIDPKTKDRIDKIINGEYDEQIRNRVRDKAIHLTTPSDFKGLPVWLASYIVYDRHSESKEVMKWEKPEDIDLYLKKFKQHSLRNPIVEQVITETLRVVRDIWKQYAYSETVKDVYGKVSEGVSELAEIHVELGREMKNNKADREKISRINIENENTNLRIKRMLMEFVNPEFEIENVRPYSPSQLEILRIYEDGVLNSGVDIPDFVGDIIKKFRESDVRKQPSMSDVLRYKLWLEQKYRSPYTNEMIPLGKLFTTAYQIEHVIPQSRYFDDSFSNKVICESEINQLKENELGFEFIKNNAGRLVEISFGRPVRIMSVEEYEQFVRLNYSGNRLKMKKLLMDEIPNDFIERQLNDSRYISRVVKGLLSNIVREEGEEEPTSKNMITCTGGITDRLKKDWGLNDVWNTLISPRFERLNQLTGSQQFGYWDTKDGKTVFQIQMPLELQKGFSKKRIDHRHHAMDALVIACATRSHVNYLNNESAKASARETRYDLRRKLRKIETIQRERIIDGRKVLQNIEVAKEFHKPWRTFTEDAQNALSEIVVSFKNNLRVINKSSNYYSIMDSAGRRIKEKQKTRNNWAIRKPMHKDTVYGKVNLRRCRTVPLSSALSDVNLIKDLKLRNKIKELIRIGYDSKRIVKYFRENQIHWKNLNSSAVEIFYFTDNVEKQVATRKFLDESFTEKKIVNSITDTGIQKILLAHLELYGNNPETAFSQEGIEEMNRNLIALNGGKFHQPIHKVRVHEPLGNKFPVGTTGNKSLKYVRAAEGTNLYFAIYQDPEGKRTYESIPLNLVIERLKQKLPPVPDTNATGLRLLFWLSPNDLVYVPAVDEAVLFNGQAHFNKERIYRFIDSSGSTANFVPHSSANIIFSFPKDIAQKYCSGEKLIQDEFGVGSPQSKNQRAITGEMIKEVCIPIKVNRLGEIIQVF
jgi:CRISPR-associated endonuclease Csn1